MKPDIGRLDAVGKAVKNLRAAQVDYERKRDRAGSVGMDCSPKRRGSLSASMTTAAMDVERQWDALHAALVDLGMCPPKDAYEQRAQHLSGFHDHAYQPAVPATIKDSLKVAQPAEEGGNHA
ncbi:hypothetical protein [Achromobacter xylosoxidans]|uniref:Uncharacterized protein n=1 Tax=Alcaligenes xylosoxydans xylosoxydans TaxID=85698 RepID=A0A0X8NXS9_ALCXX|nr:hypothetical protein [Achromobacter xylosoxidans]AMG36287.1 hypothetical protein AL504_09745 [Achromobacter xylosoxidans]